MNKMNQTTNHFGIPEFVVLVFAAVVAIKHWIEHVIDELTKDEKRN